MDRFFDALNVGSFTNGIVSRKKFQLPYRSGHDFRLKVNVFEVNGVSVLV